ncbi:MAG: SCO family protein [Bacteroidota bacterium]
MKFKFNYYWLLGLLPLFFLFWYVLKIDDKKPIRYLPYYGPKTWSESKDTAFHTIPDFAFTNQYGEMITNRNVAGKIYVCEYFFTTCKSICPIMNTNMEKVYKQFKKNDDFLILSHTVDPETDSIPVLLNYARKHGVNDQHWQFLTGSKKELYGLARKGYLLSADEGDGGADDFVHTQNFALVDWNGHIRGYYDGTDSLEVNRLMIEINLLKQEHGTEKQNNH